MSRVRWDREGADWPNREASRFVDAAGMRWHVQVSGEGPVLLLIHGTGAATHSWRGLIPLLAPHFTIVAPDLPGHGFTSPGPSGAMTLPGMAARLEELLDTLGLQPELAAGHSAGAAVAIRMTLNGRTKIAGVASFNGALLPFQGLAARLFPALARMLFLNPLVPSLMAQRARRAGEVERFLLRATGSRIDRAGVDQYARLFATSAHCAAALAMMAHWDLDSFAADLPRLSLPLSLAYGTRDAAVPPWVARRASGLVSRSKLLEMKGLGHLAHEEDPEAAAAIIQALAKEALA